jgi:hypothetical protein
LVTFAHTTDNGSKEDDAKRIHVSLERDRATHYIFRWHIAIEMVKKKTKKIKIVSLVGFVFIVYIDSKICNLSIHVRI